VARFANSTTDPEVAGWQQPQNRLQDFMPGQAETERMGQVESGGNFARQGLGQASDGRGMKSQSHRAGPETANQFSS